MRRVALPEMLSSLPRLLCTVCMAAPPPTSKPIYSVGRRVHLPAIAHATLEHDPNRPRTIIVGDIHGCLDELKALLAACEYDARTTRVVLVGDLVNKGPFSAESVKFVRESGFLCVRGNHDDAVLFAWEEREAERHDGGAPLDASDKYAYTDDFSADDVQFLRSLPHTLRLPFASAIVVHAGLVPGVPLVEQEAAAMITMRNLLPNGTDTAAATAGRRRWTHTSEGAAWGAQWRPEEDEAALAGISHVIFGHDAKRGLQQHAHATGLDTGACYGNGLSALVLPEKRIVKVPSLRVYSDPKSPKQPKK